MAVLIKKAASLQLKQTTNKTLVNSNIFVISLIDLSTQGSGWCDF